MYNFCFINNMLSVSLKLVINTVYPCKHNNKKSEYQYFIVLFTFKSLQKIISYVTIATYLIKICYFIVHHQIVLIVYPTFFSVVTQVLKQR